MAREGPFRQIAPDRLEVREGGGCLSLFGFPFFAAGIFVALIGSRIVPVDNPQDVPQWGWPLIILMGVVFTGVGIGLMFGRNWTVIDKRLGKISKRWGLLIPFRSRDYYLHQYNAVLVQYNAGDSETSDHFPVLLRGKHGVEDLMLTNPTEYGKARRGAAQVARILRFSLVDTSTDHDTVIQTEDVDDTFRERLESLPEPAETVPPPLEMKSRVDTSGGTLRIDIPGPGFRPASLLGFLIPAALLFMVIPHLAEFFRETETPQFVRFFFLGFIVFFFGVVPFMSVLHGVIQGFRSRTRITASSAEFVIEERGAFRTNEEWLQGDEIFGLDFGTVDSALASAQARRLKRYGGPSGPGSGGPVSSPKWLKGVARLARSKGITVKSGRGFFTFGNGLPDAEVRYLYSLVKAALSGKVVPQ